MVCRDHIKNLTLINCALLLSLMVFFSPAEAVTVGYLYTLSDFSGPVPYTGGGIFVDKKRNEAYVLYQNTVRLYNSNGLEIYRFGDNKDLGIIRGLAVEQDGSILFLSYDVSGNTYQIIQCNFRGDPTGKIEITGLPPGFEAFKPDHIAIREAQIYLADSRRLLVAVIDEKGSVVQSHDFFALLALEEKDRDNADMDGFSVDNDGSMLFTLPVLFRAYRVSPDGKFASFGKPGSIPGKFGIVSGIIADSHGNILVSDKLKSVVSVFDKNFKFLLEFGHRGNGPDNLVIPQDMAVDSNDRIYVVQAGNRGVSVFRMQYAN